MDNRVAGLVTAVAALAISATACSSPTPTPAPVTVTQTTVAQAPAVPAAPATPVAPVATTEAAAAAQITIPDVAGQNAERVQKHLETLGLTDVSLSSANPKYSMVLLPENWTVVSIEPAPGTQVSADEPIVVKVTKE